MLRMGASVGLIALGLAAAFASARVPRDVSHTNDFVALFPLEILAVVVAGVLAARAPGTSGVGVGVYLLVLAAIIGTLFPLWLPEDDTILGSAVLAGALAGVGAPLALYLSRPLVRGVVALVTFVLVTASGWVAPLAQLHVGLALVLAIVAYVLWRARPSLQHLLWVAIASLFTAVVLVLRGPDDWASASTSVKLYSFPVLVIALGLSLRTWGQGARS